MSEGLKIRRVSITDPRDMPISGIAETPGGTIFGTTPGGTRIIYERAFLLQRKGVPASQTPPKLPQIPGVTCPYENKHPTINENSLETKTSPLAKSPLATESFQYKPEESQNQPEPEDDDDNELEM